MARQIDISDEFEEHWNRWLEQKAYRVGSGDNLSAERRVEHVIFFRSGWHAKRAMKLITRTRSVRLSQTNGRPRWILEAITDDDTLEDASVRHALEYLITVARMFRGEYDGFAAPIVSS
jgi:hypothetical protein